MEVVLIPTSIQETTHLMSDCTVRLDRELVMYSYILMSHLSSIFQFLSDPVNGVSKRSKSRCGKYGEKSFGGNSRNKNQTVFPYGSVFCKRQ